MGNLLFTRVEFMSVGPQVSVGQIVNAVSNSTSVC